MSVKTTALKVCPVRCHWVAVTLMSLLPFAGMPLLTGCGLYSVWLDMLGRADDDRPADHATGAHLNEDVLVHDPIDLGPTAIPNLVGLEKFSCDTVFKTYLAEQVQTRDRWYDDVWGPLPGTSMDIPDAAGPAVADPLPAPDIALSDGDFSTTNIQEEGVDEGDFVKNDGSYLYIVRSGQLYIVRAVPADHMEVVSVVELPGSTAELYLLEDRLVAVGDQYAGSGWYDPFGWPDEYGHSDGTVVITVIDISERTAPALIATLQADGSLAASRMIGSRLHLALRTWPNIPSSFDDVSVGCEAPILCADIDALIPDLVIIDPDGTRSVRNLFELDGLYYPVEPSGFELTAVVTIDVESPHGPTPAVAVMADVGVVYASTEALYITDTDVAYDGEAREATDVYKFEFRPDGPVLKGTGSIPGRLLNRFSLGEYQGYLRAATTIGHVSRSGPGDASNNVYVLGEEDGELVVTGWLEGIAPGERIYSARFIGMRGFLVTFKKVDPLFTLDLSDPTRLKLVGQLKVPGYSDYIHPLGENHLLTIGKDAVDVGDFAWFQGVQLSLFDVSDFANPWRVDVETVGDRGTDSEALRDPHAFNYFAPNDLLAVPMSIAEHQPGITHEPYESAETVFSGLCLYRVTVDEGIEPVTRIATAFQDTWDNHWWGSTRGVFIGNWVYAVTAEGVRAVSLDNPNGPRYELPLD